MSFRTLLTTTALSMLGYSTMAQSDASVSQDSLLTNAASIPNDYAVPGLIDSLVKEPKKELQVVYDARGNIESILYFDYAAPLNEIGTHLDIDKSEELRRAVDSQDFWSNFTRLFDGVPPRERAFHKVDRSAATHGIPQGVPITLIPKVE